MLTPAPAEQLATDGVTGPFPAFVDQRTLKDLRDFFDEILASRRPQPLYRRYALRDWHLVHEPLRDLLIAPSLVRTLREISNAESLLLWRTKLFEKFSGDGPVDWHQEYGYFDGEEIGGHRPALYPMGTANPWCWTVWLPLTNITLDDGVMEFVLGSHARRYATRMVSLTESGAFPYTDPSNRATTKGELLERARNNSLVLDVDTHNVFDGVPVDGMSLDEMITLLKSHLARTQAVITEPFVAEPEQLRVFPMDAGQYIVFNQRTMHRSRGAGNITRTRLAISARYTIGSTLVYPQKDTADPVDGSNLNIRSHHCICLYGTAFNPENKYL